MAVAIPRSGHHRVDSVRHAVGSGFVASMLEVAAGLVHSLHCPARYLVGVRPALVPGYSLRRRACNAQTLYERFRIVSMEGEKISCPTSERKEVSSMGRLPMHAATQLTRADMDCFACLDLR